MIELDISSLFRSDVLCLMDGSSEEVPGLLFNEVTFAWEEVERYCICIDELRYEVSSAMSTSLLAFLIFPFSQLQLGLASRIPA